MFDEEFELTTMILYILHGVSSNRHDRTSNFNCSHMLSFNNLRNICKYKFVKFVHHMVKEGMLFY